MTAPAWFFAERVLLALTFALSAVAKARGLDSFHSTLQGLGIASDRTARRLAPAVVAAEAAVVVLVVASPATAVVGSVLAAGMLVVFTAVLARARARGTTIGCACFGATRQPVSWYDVARNALLLAAIAGALLLGEPSGPPPLATAALVVPACAAAVLVLVNLREVVESLVRPLAEEGGP